MKFEIGKVYYARGATGTRLLIRVVDRRDTTIKIIGFRRKICKVLIDDEGNEYVIPERYANNPIFNAKHYLERRKESD